MKVRILVTLKKGVLDTQGKAIENSLVKDLGFSQISQVRQETNPESIKEIVDALCDKVLVNKVIENYTYEIIS